MKIQTIAFRSLGTLNTIEIPASPDKDSSVLLEKIRDEIFRLDDLLSCFKKNSEISKINRAAGSKLVSISEDTFSLLSDALYYGHMTDGLFDVTAGPLIKLWGIGKKGTFVPSAEEIQKAQSLVNYQDIILEGPSPLRAGLKKEGECVDLGGIAKGFAVDRALDMLKEAKVSDAVINFGGSVSVTGHERTAAVQNPFNIKEPPVKTLRLRNASLVTSGTYEQFFIKDGIRYHHILDPKTGYPAREGLISATLTGASAEELDAYTTSIILLGQKKGMSLMKTHNIQGILITDGGDVFCSDSLEYQS